MFSYLTSHNHQHYQSAYLDRYFPPDQLKNSSVHHHLKKSYMDTDNLGNYRPISHLSSSRVTEKVVKLCLVHHLWSSNTFFNAFQSAYVKHHSTETTLFSIHDHFVKAMSYQQVICLTLLALSAAFDTTGHFILLERLSPWFGISSITLFWIKSYLLNRYFFVNIDNLNSSVFQILYGVPQGSVLGSLLFIQYTFSLSTVISNSSANYQLHADDSRLLLSLSDFSHNTTHSPWKYYS